VSGNDVWQQGVGPETNSDVPLTDITGAARKGTTANPGAFELDGYVAPTTIVKTIGSGKDYANPLAAFNDLVNIASSATPTGSQDLTYENCNIVFEIDAGTYDQWSLSLNSPWFFDQTRNITVKAAKGAEHKGIPRKGVYISPTYNINIIGSFLTIQDIEFNTTLNRYIYNAGAFKGMVFDRCLLTGGPNAVIERGRGTTAQSYGTAAFPNKIKNTVIRNFGGWLNPASVAYGPSDDNVEDHFEYINVTFIGWHRTSGSTIASRKSHTKFVNCIVFNSYIALADQNRDQIIYSGEYNFGTASNAFPVELRAPNYPIVPTQYNYDTDVATGDQAVYGRGTGRLANILGNKAWNAGRGPDANSDVTVFDIAGEKRSGFTANPGAFEIPLTIPTTKTVITKTIDPDGEGDYVSPATAEADITNILNNEIGYSDLYEANAELKFSIKPGEYI
jgi:hypothetical protein